MVILLLFEMFMNGICVTLFSGRLCLFVSLVFVAFEVISVSLESIGCFPLAVKKDNAGRQLLGILNNY